VNPARDHENGEDVDAPLGESPHEQSNLPRIHVSTTQRDEGGTKESREAERVQVSGWLMRSGTRWCSDSTSFPASSVVRG
jgi:hypothetical protein